VALVIFEGIQGVATVAASISRGALDKLLLRERFKLARGEEVGAFKRTCARESPA